MEYTIQPVGTIYTPFKTKEACPIQGVVDPASVGRVEILPEFEAALETIETFTHLYLFYLFDRAGEIILSRPTFLDDAPHGVFASRHPCRPNGIGLSIVRLDKRVNNVLHVGEIDILDRTPLIDIKPYVPRFDHRPTAGNGWVASKPMSVKPPDRE